jgi:ammonia channel protein AmtB
MFMQAGFEMVEAGRTRAKKRGAYHGLESCHDLSLGMLGFYVCRIRLMFVDSGRSDHGWLCRFEP